MPTLLELFSGTGSIGKAFEARGWEVIAVDINRNARHTIRCDVKDFDVKKHLPSDRRIDAIWASPPCTQYSIARRSGPPRDLEGSDRLVRKVLEIANELGDPPLFIENPQSGLLKNRGILDHIPMRVVDYCRYGTPYRKRTAIWTNTEWRPARPLCGKQCGHMIGNSHEVRARRWSGGNYTGPSFSRNRLHVIPAELCDEIADYCS